MSRTSKKTDSPPENLSPVLPAPPLVIEHHGKTLFPILAQWQKSKKIPPVLLLTGQTGIGKRTMGYFLSQWIFCEKSGMSTAAHSDSQESQDFFGSPASVAPTGETSLTSCGSCAACVKALKNHWVDFTEILPEEDSETKAGILKIDQFRNLKSTLGYGGHEGSYKITLIPNADRMTTQAANSLLKLLEEPPAGWLFFLTASDTTLILPTLISRCQMIKLKPFQAEELKPLLRDLPPERAQLAAALASGSWGKALALGSDEVWEQRALIFGLLKNPKDSMGLLIDWAVTKPSQFDLLLDQLEQITSDLIKWTLSENRGSYIWINSDGSPLLKAHANHVMDRMGSLEQAREFWFARAERLGRARQESLAPLNRKSLLQEILLPWLEIAEARARP
jgi:hypothetical protein